MKNDWKNNKVVKKICKLRKDYEFRHLYAGTGYFGGTTIENLYRCDCCGNLTANTESLYHKTIQYRSIGVCCVCSNLWRLVPVI